MNMSSLFEKTFKNKKSYKIEYNTWKDRAILHPRYNNPSKLAATIAQMLAEAQPILSTLLPATMEGFSARKMS
jgi:hypothetical protein